MKDLKMIWDMKTQLPLFRFKKEFDFRFQKRNYALNLNHFLESAQRRKIIYNNDNKNSSNNWNNYSKFKKLMIKFIWKISIRWMILLKSDSKYIDIIDKILMKNYVKNNLVIYMNSFEIPVSKYNKKEGSVNITFYNRHQYHRKLLYIHLWYCIISNEEFKKIPLNVFISTATNKDKERSYSLHNNFLFADNRKLNCKLKKFLINAKPNLRHILTEPYFADPCDYIKVQIWDVTPNSSYISDLKNRERSDENSKILKILKDYNTKIGNRRSYSTFVSKKNLVN